MERVIKQLRFRPFLILARAFQNFTNVHPLLLWVETASVQLRWLQQTTIVVPRETTATLSSTLLGLVGSVGAFDYHIMSTSQRAQTAWSPPSLSTATVLASSSILQDGYKDALEQCRLMVTSGHLSTQEYEALATATTAEDVIRAFQSALESNKHSRKTSNFQVRRIFEPLMLRLERFTTAFDMLVQASPQVFGFNPAGIVWGSLKITLTVSANFALLLPVAN